MTEVSYWAGWVGGLAIGSYTVLQLWLTGKVLGVSTAYGNVCALASKHAFFRKGPYENAVNWRLWFLLGLPLGGLIAALTSDTQWIASLSLGPMYESVFPSAWWAKGLILTGGGILIGFGARAAGGCPSGHSIAGLSLLNPPSFLASAGFFIGGIVAVQLLFRVLA